MKSHFVIATVIVILGNANAASGQYVMPSVISAVVGEMAASAAEDRCLSGEAPNGEKVAAVRAQAQDGMARYVAVAGQRTGIDMTSLFVTKPKYRRWSKDGVVGDVRAIDDPAARNIVGAGSALPEASAFVVAGDGKTAVGRWAAAPSAPYEYRAQFRREAGLWKLATLALSSGGDDTITQYCHAPDDVAQYLARKAEYDAERARKSAEKAARLAAKRAASTSTR